jgi:AraC-like DNA-binding protein
MTILDRAQPYLADLEKRALTTRALADLLGCHECYLSRLLAGRIKRTESSTKARKNRHKLFESRKEMRQKHADLVANGAKSLKKAAADARCSERTIRRYIDKLRST